MYDDGRKQSSPPSGGTHFVRCLKCLKILKCSRYDTTALLAHIKSDHPEIEIIDSASQIKKSPYGGNETMPERIEAPPDFSNRCNAGAADGGGYFNEETLQQEMMKRENVCQNVEEELLPPGVDDNNANKANMDGSQVFYTRRYKVNTPQTPKTARKRKLYRTSIEKWRPANGTLYCPKCGVCKRPLIKTRTERVATNSCAAACLLGCWPFCFLPCLVSGGNNKEYLHCANCKTFLGLFDRANNCIKPNKEYVEYLESARQQGSMGQSDGAEQTGNYGCPQEQQEYNQY